MEVHFRKEFFIKLGFSKQKLNGKEERNEEDLKKIRCSYLKLGNAVQHGVVRGRVGYPALPWRGGCSGKSAYRTWIPSR